MKTLPKQFYRYFWDTKPEFIDVESKPDYVIARLMDYGHTSAIAWMRSEYSDDVVRKTLMNRRGISRQSAYFWSKILNLNIEEVICLQKPYRKIPYGV